MISVKCYWSGMSSDIRIYVSDIYKVCMKPVTMCVIIITRFHCVSSVKKNNYKLKMASGQLHQIPVEPKLWHQFGMDLIGPLTQIPRGNKYIVTVTDYFLKWAEAGLFLIKQLKV